jgi:hypothetical protein
MIGNLFREVLFNYSLASTYVMKQHTTVFILLCSESEKLPGRTKDEAEVSTKNILQSSVFIKTVQVTKYTYGSLILLCHTHNFVQDK